MPQCTASLTDRQTDRRRDDIIVPIAVHIPCSTIGEKFTGKSRRRVYCCLLALCYFVFFLFLAFIVFFAAAWRNKDVYFYFLTCESNLHFLGASAPYVLGPSTSSVLHSTYPHFIPWRRLWCTRMNGVVVSFTQYSFTVNAEPTWLHPLFDCDSPASRRWTPTLQFTNSWTNSLCSVSCRVCLGSVCSP